MNTDQKMFFSVFYPWFIRGLDSSLSLGLHTEFVIHGKI